MKKNTLVSIVIPVFNEEKYLAMCLTSLLEQSYGSFQIICIDDGSTDNSRTVIKSFPKVLCLTQDHKGPGQARNTGAAVAKGEILAFADADMRYDKAYIAKLIAPIIQGKAIGTFTKEEYVANPDNLWSRCWSINSGLPINRRIPEKYQNKVDAFRAIKKSYFMKGNGFEINEGYTDDGSLSKKIHVLSLAAKGAICYHYNPTSLSEVFYSARWIGRSKLFPPTIENFFRFSFFNSLRVSGKYLRKRAPLAIILFKLVYDAGMFVGVFLSNGQTAK